MDTLHEIEIFKGSENTLTMRQTYTYKFQCVFQLSRYPFDTQVARYGPFRNIGLMIYVRSRIEEMIFFILF